MTVLDALRDFDKRAGSECGIVACNRYCVRKLVMNWRQESHLIIKIIICVCLELEKFRYKRNDYL